MGMSTETAPLRDRLRAAVPAALKARDRRTASALRSALAAIDNAEAVDLAELAGRDGFRAGAIEHSPVGLGVAEVARRELSEDDVAAIVRVEVEDRRSAAATYEAAGQAERAADLLAEADSLAVHLAAGR
jgi:uncharacterized protein YqeY